MEVSDEGMCRVGYRFLHNIFAGVSVCARACVCVNVYVCVRVCVSSKGGGSY